MATQRFHDPLPPTRPWDLAGPAPQQLAAHGCQPHPFGQSLAIHFPAQHPQPDQPEEMVLGPVAAEGNEGERGGRVGLADELLAAEGLAFHRLIEAAAERKAPERESGPCQGKGLGVGLWHRPILPNRRAGWRALPVSPLLLLASASPARRRLLEQAGVPHRVQVSGVDEEGIQEQDPLRLVQRLALAKAEAVASTLNPEASWPSMGVLGCDSVLVVQQEVWGKPKDAAEAITRWRRMAGGWGDLHTGHALVRRPAPEGSADTQRAVVTTRVHFGALSAGEIEAYVASGEPLACAGGFALEGRGGLMVERLEGCVSNVIGLSLPLLRHWLTTGGSCST